MTPTPIRIDRALMRVFRTADDYAMVFGPRHADALKRLIEVARSHNQEIDVCLLNDGHGKESIVARVAGAQGWSVVS